MQNSRLLTIEGRLKVKILSGVIMLLLVGLHPVRVLADADSSSTSDTSATVSAAPADTTTDPTTTDTSPISTPVSTPTDTSGSTDTSSSSTPQTTDTPTGTTSASSPATTEDNTDKTASSPTLNNADNASTDGNSVTVTNQATSAAQSGDASVSHSSTAGNATTGNAQTIATALNILSSSTDVQPTDVNTSVTNISGNNNSKNVVIDPTISGGSPDPAENDQTEVNTASSGTIDNNLTLGAASGDATVAGNRVGGNATSGNATVDANLINITNSDVNSGQYYIGVINIYGDLTGNILLSPEFVSQLLAENPSLLSGDTTAANNVNQTISNTVNASATSGNASVLSNRVGGNATSGNATTNVNTYDLANSTIVGNNALLVFINVLGTWEGVIIGAPSGANMAVYGDNTSGSNTANAASATATGSNEATLASATNEEIDNTINATAVTGNATVAYNGVGGNATSGNAEVSVNLLNILNSDVSLSGWFGVLFINVFGNWSGDFGVITPASVTTTAETTGISAVKHAVSLGQSIANDAYTFFDQSSIPTVTPGQVLGTTASATTSNPLANGSGTRNIASTAHNSRTWWLPAIAGMILSASSLGLERILRQRKQNS